MSKSKLKNRKWNRILKLADFMEKLPRKRFDFSVIVGPDWKGAKDLSCGTTACSLGWATVIPLFRRLGLHIDLDSSVAMGNGDDWGVIGAEVFGVNSMAMFALFQPNVFGKDKYKDLYGCYPVLESRATPKQWAKHARKIVNQLQTEEQI